ncbi:MAG: DUF167 domain-containing protein [Dehalococcoidales bacterium]|nr:DUF167 domain-containing protein [Dehalococcoidales bacterium]
MAKITIQAHPGAKRNEVIRCVDGVWHVKIAAPPIEGKANKKLIEFLSEVLDIPKSAISIDKGATGKRKMVEITGVTIEAITRKLGKYLLL